MGIFLPEFNTINIAQAEKNLDALLKKNIEKIESLLQQNHFSWGSLLQPIEDMSDELHHFWAPIQHLSTVVNSSPLREVVRACLPKLSDYHTQIEQNKKLFDAITAIKNSDEFKNLSFAQQKSIENDLRDFTLAGVHLEPTRKKQFAELAKILSEQSQQFEENVLDATMAWKKNITDEAILSGIPGHAKNAAKANAIKNNLSGWLLTLEAPDYLAVMLNADSEKLRREIYEAYVTRASDQGPFAKKFDNSSVMCTILKARFEMAALLNLNNYAEYSLATKMVKKPAEVLSFLNKLAEKCLSKAKIEFAELTQFAKNELGIEKLNAWDITYASEKLRQQKYAISQEDLRPYFPESQVLLGLFEIINRLYGISLTPVDNKNAWHSDVRCFQLRDKKNHIQAHLLLDLYARENKRGGAWMDECSIRRKLNNDTMQLPAAYVICNFNGPIGDDPALFTHQDVETLFHECGHALQHVLTQMDIASVSGIHGIPWDAVEIASQFFENWAWHQASLAYLTKHYQTGEALPDDLFQKMHRAKHFQSAMQMMRQLELALFDFQLHLSYDENDDNCIQNTLNEIRKKVSVVPTPGFNRFQHGFSHIFGGGYAAGYYSYKWAEVMACDAFSLFEEKGIFDAKTSEKFKNTFLAYGGAKDPLDVFVEFRGRKPELNALLKKTGVV